MPHRSIVSRSIAVNEAEVPMVRASAGRILVLALVLAIPTVAAPPITSSKGATPRPPKGAAEFFEKQIRPILVRHCYECHSGDPKKAKGGFVLDTQDGPRKGGKSGAAIEPGHPDTSLLIEAVRYESLEMPPKGKLPDETIDKLVKWVEMGAPDPRVGKAAQSGGKIDVGQAKNVWAFQHPKAANPPAVRDKAWPQTDIDHFVRTKQEAEKLKPVADADRVTLIRRVTFDLTGLPPTLAEIDAFVNDKSPQAFATVVDRLFASPRFGERWARHWLDVVRYGESTGRELNLPFRFAWRYRNYVIDAFNADKPFDRFIVEQLAGDMLPAKTTAERDQLAVATGFLAVGPKTVAEGPEQYRYDVIDDQIDVTGRAFLGLTIACARCHDHKFDPIPTSDYYAVAGIFRSTDTMCGTQAGARVVSEARLLRLAEPGGKDNALTAEERERRDQIAQLEKQLEHLRELLKPGKKPSAVKPEQTPKEIRDQIRDLQAKLDKLEAVPSGAVNFAIGVREGTPGNSPLLNHGELKDKGAEVPRGTLTVLKTAGFRIDPKHSGRLALAHGIASKDNPLTARVFVNRVWAHLFGQGLVASVDNFGALGEEPSNPLLLDTLAVHFMNDHSWSIKKLIRAIVLSRTYRLGSAHDDAAFAMDPSNKFLWRMTPRRLDAEEIRDGLLAASGELVVERPTEAATLELDNGLVRPGKVMQEARSSTHRSIYLPIIRNSVPDALQVFDVADPNLIVGQRDVTTVAPQALFLMNNPFVIARANQMARRLLANRDAETDARIDLAYRSALGRVAGESEKAAIKSYLTTYRKSLAAAEPRGNPELAAWASFCQTLFASGEFRYRY
jgi:hypothetical protein